MTRGSRSIAAPRLVALVCLLAMLVLIGFEVQALTWESGDRVLHLSYAGVAVGTIASVAAGLWVAWAPRRAGAIAVLVVTVLLNPIWLLLLIRAFG